MVPTMRTVGEILEELGGVTKVARALGLPISTVHTWSRKNAVPAWRRDNLVGLARKARKPLAKTELLPSEAA